MAAEVAQEAWADRVAGLVVMAPLVAAAAPWEALKGLVIVAVAVGCWGCRQGSAAARMEVEATGAAAAMEAAVMVGRHAREWAW